MESCKHSAPLRLHGRKLEVNAARPPFLVGCIYILGEEEDPCELANQVLFVRSCSGLHQRQFGGPIRWRHLDPTMARLERDVYDRRETQLIGIEPEAALLI